jgi:outer membrane biosynthesis protein TonB
MAATEKINIKAAAWTISVHVLLLLLFLFISYSIPASIPVQEMGMEVNLGTDDNGSGDIQPMSPDEHADKVKSEAATATQDAGVPDIMKIDDADAPAVTTKTHTGSNTTQTTTHPDKVVHQQPRYLYAGGNNTPANQQSSSEGNTTGNGDRGVHDGTGGNNYTGNPGAGNGGMISHTLSGRDITPSKFEAEFKEGGKVVIRVTVDRNGTIINKTVTSSPSPELSHIALQKLSEAKFSKNNNAEPQQFGIITIVFKTHI